MTDDFIIDSEEFYGSICCNGQVTLKTLAPQSTKIRYTIDEQVYIFDTADYPSDRHPFTVQHIHKNNGTHLSYRLHIEREYTLGWLPYQKTYDYPGSFCSPVHRVRIFVSDGASGYLYDTDTFYWKQPESFGVGIWGVNGGSARVQAFDKNNSLLAEIEYTGNNFRSLKSLKVTGFDNHANSTPCNNFYCVMYIKDKDDTIVKSIESDNFECPKSEYIPCYFDAKDTLTDYFWLEHYDHESWTGDTYTRLIWQDCLIVYRVTKSDGLKGLKVVKERRFHQTTHIAGWQGIGRVIDTDEWTDKELVGYRWSPPGCGYPLVSMSCDHSYDDPEPDKTCPPGTAFECVNNSDGIRYKCCYSCEGEVIKSIKL